MEYMTEYFEFLNILKENTIVKMYLHDSKQSIEENSLKLVEYFVTLPHVLINMG